VNSAVICLLLIPKAFSDQQLKQIERHVGGLCERRAHADVRQKFRLRYDVNNHHVFVREARPDWHNPSKWIETDVAKLRYVGASNEWRLYWKRASGKWWLYEPYSRSRTLAAMVNEIDRDAYGCFFG
jgi:Protein of unknown function (DUF3024)